MVSITSLWLPILVSSAFAWIAVALIWMVLPHHRNDFSKVSNEEAVRSALKGLEPGQYYVPHSWRSCPEYSPEPPVQGPFGELVEGGGHDDHGERRQPVTGYREPVPGEPVPSADVEEPLQPQGV